MFCSNCGSQLKDGAVFCGNCGTAISVEQVRVQPQAVYQQTAIPPQAVVPAPKSVPVYSPLPVTPAAMPKIIPELQQTVGDNWPVLLLVSIVVYTIPNLLSFIMNVAQLLWDYPFFVNNLFLIASYVLAMCAFVKMKQLLPSSIRNFMFVLLIINAIQQIYYFTQNIGRYF